jgi:hypothetical protein
MRANEYVGLLGRTLTATRQQWSDEEGWTDTEETHTGLVSSVTDVRRLDGDQDVLIDLGVNGTITISIGDLGYWQLTVG